MKEAHIQRDRSCVSLQWLKARLINIAYCHGSNQRTGSGIHVFNDLSNINGYQSSCQQTSFSIPNILSNCQIVVSEVKKFKEV